jgi:uncharacterized protein YndB with AHSA1/START domain
MTSATVAITPDQDAVEVEIFVAAPLERVFQAITDPAQTARWWGQAGLYKITETSADVRKGGKFLSAGVGADGTRFQVEGEYLEVDPPRLLVHTWTSSYGGPPKTIVRWQLESRDLHGLQTSGPRRMGTGTLVKVRHEGFTGYPESCASHGYGWTRVLSWMQAFVEKGETVDTRPAVSPGVATKA